MNNKLSLRCHQKITDYAFRNFKKNQLNAMYTTLLNTAIEDEPKRIQRTRNTTTRRYSSTWQAARAAAKSATSFKSSRMQRITIERIFAKYLTKEVKEILVEEPNVKEFYQICNIMMFCELAVTKCCTLKCIKLTTKKDGWPDSEQIKGLSQLTASLKEQNVNWIVEYVKKLHYRQVMLSNGIIVKIFKPLPSKFHLGCYNFDFRRCLQTNVDIIFSPEGLK